MDKLKLLYWLETIEESKKGIALVIILLFAIYFGIRHNSANVTEIIFLKGTVTNFQHFKTKLESRNVFTIELEDGKVIRVNAGDKIPYFKGKPVIIKKLIKETGGYTYMFYKYEPING